MPELEILNLPRPAHLGLGEVDLGPDPFRWPLRIRDLPVSIREIPGTGVEALAGPAWDGRVRLAVVSRGETPTLLVLPPVRRPFPREGGGEDRRASRGALALWEVEERLLRGETPRPELLEPALEGIGELLRQNLPGVVAELLPFEIVRGSFVPCWWGDPLTSVLHHLALMARWVPPADLLFTAGLVLAAEPLWPTVADILREEMGDEL